MADPLSATFAALADPTRRAVLARLAQFCFRRRRLVVVSWIGLILVVSTGTCLVDILDSTGNSSNQSFNQARITAWSTRRSVYRNSSLREGKTQRSDPLLHH